MRVRWMRQALGVGIALFWGVMMFLLMQRERAANQPLDAPPVDWVAGSEAGPTKPGRREEWMGIYLNGTKLGYAVHRTVKRAGGYRVTGRSHLMLTLQGAARGVETYSAVEVGAGHQMRSFEFSLKSDVQNMQVQGKQEPGRLLLTIRTGGGPSPLGGAEAKGQVTTRVVPLSKPITIPDALTSILARTGRLRPNTTHDIEIFDPMTLSPGTATIRVGESEKVKSVRGSLDALRTTMTYRGFSATAWITPEGETLKEESSMGWTMVRQTRESAMQVLPGRPGADLVLAARIRTNVHLNHARYLRFLRAEMTGADFTTLSLATERQKLDDPEGGRIEVRAEDLKPENALKLPVRAPEMRLYLQPDALTQSDHPEIRAAAREAVGGETNSWKAAVRIGQWVHDALEKTPTISMPSALDVLRTRKGDCNEHTQLFVAMARAAGIPAEVCAGIVYVNDGFYYHAWPRVWVGRWVSLDPTFGQEIADATHIELVHGGLDRQSEILRLVGRLEVRIIRTE